MRGISRLIDAIRPLGVSCARLFEEELDQQFKALEHLSQRLTPEELIKVTVLNALCSYQLSCTGERWWWELAKHYETTGDILSSYVSFLRSSRCNRRLRHQKENRLRKVWPELQALRLEELRELYEDMLTLRDLLAEVLGSTKNAKTVTFAVKMFGYASRIAFDHFLPYPMEIDIPLDLRVRDLTRRLTGAELSDGECLEVWRDVALQTGVPPLHLDSLIWPLYGMLRKGAVTELPCDGAEHLLEVLRVYLS